MPRPKQRKPNPEEEPYPIYSVDEYKIIPKRVKIDNERFFKHFNRKLAEKDRELAETKQQLIETDGKRREGEEKILILNERVNYLEKQGHDRFGISTIQTGSLFMGSILAGLGLSPLITNSLLNFTLVAVGVALGLFGIFCLFLLKPKGGKK